MCTRHHSSLFLVAVFATEPDHLGARSGRLSSRGFSDKGPSDRDRYLPMEAHSLLVEPDRVCGLCIPQSVHLEAI